jgi:ketosteroid isomerase-like protein
MRILTTLAAASLLALLSCTQPTGQSGSDGQDAAAYQADVQAILDFEQTVYDAQIGGDFDAWMSSFAEDAIVMLPNAPALTDKLAIRRWNAPIFEQFDLHEESDFREVEVAGDWGYIRAHWIWTQTPKGGGKSVKDTGYSIWIVRRQPDGSWKITRGIFNSENPIPGAE